MRQIRIAAASYPLDWFDGFADYERKVTAWVEDAADCDLLVFPEYASMELASLGGEAIAADLEASLREVERHREAALELFERLARESDSHILAPSMPVFLTGRPVNRAYLFGPDGPLGYQDKIVMTRFERELWDVVGGHSVRLFDTDIGKLGVLICYDAEFPLFARRLAEAGAELLLVPSCTDSLAGYNRVRIGAMARALENQCVVVQSPTVNDASWSPAVDENVGAAAFYGPADGLWPATGVIAEGKLNQPGWVKTSVDLELVEKSRAEGAVLTFRDWPESAVVDLRWDD